jgi:hypothetical protein
MKTILPGEFRIQGGRDFVYVFRAETKASVGRNQRERRGKTNRSEPVGMRFSRHCDQERW